MQQILRRKRLANKDKVVETKMVFQCMYCGFIQTDRHNPDTTSVTCEDCGKTYPQQWKQQLHENKTQGNFMIL